MALRAFAAGALFAETFGSGPPSVLALHGWGRRGADFAASLDGLATIAPDLPGFGASPEPETVIGAAGYAALVSELLSEYESKPVVVGHSFGGRVAVCLATAYPDLVGPLVLTGVPLLRRQSGATPKMSFRVMRALNDLGVVSDERMEQLRRRSGSADYQAVSGVMRDIFVKVVNETYEDQLRSIRSTVRLVWGSDDLEVPVDVAKRALEILESVDVDSDLQILPGVGHLVPTVAPQALRGAVNEVIGR